MTTLGPIVDPNVHLWDQRLDVRGIVWSDAGAADPVVVDAVGLASGLVTLSITLRMRGSLVRPGTWRSCPSSE